MGEAWNRRHADKAVPVPFQTSTMLSSQYLWSHRHIKIITNEIQIKFSEQNFSN